MRIRGAQSPASSYRTSGGGGSHKYKYPTSPSPVRSRSSKRSERYASRSRSPRLSRYADSPTDSPRSGTHHYYRSRRSSSRYRRSRSKHSLGSLSRSRSPSRSPSSTPRDLKQKRIEYSKKISETSLFAELVKDKHKRQKALQVKCLCLPPLATLIINSCLSLSLSFYFTFRKSLRNKRRIAIVMEH